MRALTSSVVFTTLLFAFAAAQNSTSSGSSTNSTLNPQSVPLTTRNNWCLGEFTSCPLLCGGQDQLGNQYCHGDDLTYECTCKNGSSPPDIAQYQNTLPNFICQELYGQCVKENGNPESCETCGTLKPSDVQAIPLSTSTSASASATSGAPTAESAAAATTTGAAAKIHAVEGAGLVGGLLAALLL